MVENTGKEKKVTKVKRRKWKIVLFTVEIAVLLVALGVLYVYSKMSKIDLDNEVEVKEREINELPEETLETLKGYTTVALFGLDNRSVGTFARGNTDTIILASINNDTKEVKLVSVYRDTYLNITNDDGFNKANAAYAHGGASQAINMLNVNLDLDITDYVTVDFNSVVHAVDILKGIEVEITDEEAILMQGYMDEIIELTGIQSNYLWSAGTYNLDGVQATSYARIRYTLGDDFKRTERQRLVISKMAEKALDSDLATINNLANELFPRIKTSLSMSDVLALVKDAFSYSMGDNAGFPFTKEPKVVEKAGDCIVPVDLADNVKMLHEFLYESEEYEVTPSVNELSKEIESKTGLSAKSQTQQTQQVQQAQP